MNVNMKVAAVVLAMSVAGFAQHGAPGGAMGGHGGMGGPGMGGPAMGGPGVGGMGSGPSASHGMDMPGSAPGGSMGKPSSAPNMNMSKQSPQDILNRNSQLSSNLDKLLPAGTTAQQACSGFKNLGQCVAAIHVSHNLGIPFSDLKSKMTGDHSEKLGKAIQTLKPDVNAKAESKKAERQAKQDLKHSKA